MTNTAEIIKLSEQKLTKGLDYVKADTDNGYYRIANQLGEALCKVHLSDRESRIVHAIMIKTFGWQKPTDWICNGQLSELTDIGITHISTIKKGLEKRNIIIIDGKKIGINPVVSEWVLTTNESSKKHLPRLNKTPKQVKDSENPKHLNRLNKTPEQVKQTPKQVKNIPQTGAHKRKTLITKERNTIVPKRQLKPKIFKSFFNAYPAHRKGGTDAQAWKVWKSEKLTEQDIEIAVKWLTLAAKTNSDWRTDAKGQYVQGITKFIREKIWLTPIPQQSFSTTTLEPNDTSWAEGFELTVP